MWAARLLQDPALAALVAPVVAAGGSPAPAPRVAPRCSDEARVAAAFGYALRFGLATRGAARIRSLRAFVGLELMRVVRTMQPELAVARASVERAFGVLARFDDGVQLAPECAEACFWLADVEAVATRGQLDLQLRVTGFELQELCDLYALIPWPAFSATERLEMDCRFNLGSLLAPGAGADFLLDDALVHVEMSAEPGRELADRARGVLGAIIANRYGVTGLVEPPVVRQIGTYYARSGVLRTAPLAEHLAPELTDRLAEAIQKHAAERFTSLPARG